MIAIGFLGGVRWLIRYGVAKAGFCLCIPPLQLQRGPEVGVGGRERRLNVERGAQTDFRFLEAV